MLLSYSLATARAEGMLTVVAGDCDDEGGDAGRAARAALHPPLLWAWHGHQPVVRGARQAPVLKSFILPSPPATAQHDTCCGAACVRAMRATLVPTPAASGHWLYRELWSVARGSFGSPRLCSRDPPRRPAPVSASKGTGTSQGCEGQRMEP